MGKSFQVRENVFVLPIDMENRSVEDIARDAASSIVEVCDQIGRQRDAEKKESQPFLGGEQVNKDDTDFI